MDECSGSTKRKKNRQVGSSSQRARETWAGLLTWKKRILGYTAQNDVSKRFSRLHRYVTQLENSPRARRELRSEIISDLSRGNVCGLKVPR